MNTYLFSTFTDVKPYMNGKYWVDSNLIGDSYICADNVEEALNEFKDNVCREAGVVISKTAMKHKTKMFIDDSNGNSIHCGYVITGKTEVYDRDYNICGVRVYLDLWVKINRVENPFLDVK